ncbi:MAG: hypothetical protein DDT35_01536 [Firmicutes bacterium]|nr:hypothetical protein [Bacillota bacterium]
MLTKIHQKTVALLRCKKGASSELLAAVGLIAITAGIITVVSPVIRTNVSTIVTNVLARASTLFATVGAP